MNPRARRITIGAAVCVAALVVIMTVACWRQLTIQYYVYRLRRDAEYLMTVLQFRETERYQQALVSYLRAEDGREGLIKLFLDEFIQTFDTCSQSFFPGGSVKPGRTQILEAERVALWIGPKTHGLQPAGENVAIHIISDSTNGVFVVRGETSIKRLKSLGWALTIIRGEAVELEAYQGYCFRVMTGRELIQERGELDLSKHRPREEDVVCVADRP